MADIGDLHDLALALKTASADALDTIPAFDATLDGAPARQLVTFGQPVFDCCDQLAVHVVIVNQADTSPGGLSAGKRHLTGTINHVTFLITSTRCVPMGFDNQTGLYTPPPAASLEAAAKQLDADAWALWNHLYALQSSDLLLSLCDEVFFDGITAILPSGGCAGWTAQVRTYLGGYPVVFGT